MKDELINPLEKRKRGRPPKVAPPAEQSGSVYTPLLYTVLAVIAVFQLYFLYAHNRLDLIVINNIVIFTWLNYLHFKVNRLKKQLEGKK